MPTDIVVPALGESVTEATIAKWMKAAGDAVAVDEPLVELETDKVTLEVFAPSAGTLAEIRAEAGATVEVGAVLGVITEGPGAAKPAAKPEAAVAPSPAVRPAEAPKPSAPPAAPAPPPRVDAAATLSPAVRKLVEESKLAVSAVPATGKDGRLTKGDVLAAVAAGEAAPKSVRAAPPPLAPAAPTGAPAPREERVRMTRLRKRIAERLKLAQNTAAMLTTFNEADMSRIMAMRGELKDAFEKKHGVRLGIMSFFVKASIVALKEIPAVNAQIDGDDLVYKNFYDIGIAVGTEQGLVVPVLRDADSLSFAEIERRIADFGRRAREGKLTLEELSGGTFTITNGGVYGSLLSTPILNPPQSGILGMHKTQTRPVAVGDRIELRPMMYLALSYDHRIVDGREAVGFLVRVKEGIEDPQRMLLET